jgi:hypothetical protein
LREDVTAIKQQTQAVHNSETNGDSETDGGSEYMHIRKIILRTTMQGNQTCLSIKIPMPRCLILPKTTVLSLALEQLIDLVGARQCEEEFRKSLYQLSSWTAAVWKTMDYSELKRSLGALVQRCKKLLVRNLPLYLNEQVRLLGGACLDCRLCSVLHPSKTPSANARAKKCVTGQRAQSPGSSVKSMTGL